MTYCALKRRRNASRDVVFIDVAEINVDFAEKQHGVRRIVSAYYYDELLRAKIHLLHSTYFMEVFMKNTQYCISLLFLRYYARVSFAIVKNCDFIKKNCYTKLRNIQSDIMLVNIPRVAQKHKGGARGLIARG